MPVLFSAEMAVSKTLMGMWGVLDFFQMYTCAVTQHSLCAKMVPSLYLVFSEAKT